MNGSQATQATQAAIQKAKQGASTSNGNASKKRKKELKPIITTDGAHDPEGADVATSSAG
jgi:hypothetical protein